MYKIIIIAWALILPRALSASCCSQAGAGGAGRLLAYERALVEFSSKGNYTFGGFNDQGQFSYGATPNLPYLSFEQNLHIMARVVDYFMPFIHLPVIIKKSDHGIGGGPGDIVLGARSNLFLAGAYWPSLALINGVKIPSGQKNTKDFSRANEDITSVNEWQGFIGLSLEKEFTPITYGLSYSLLLESLRMGHALSLSANFLLHDNGSLTISLLPTFYGPVSLNGQKLAHSHQRRLAMAANYALKLHSKLTMSINVGSDLPINYLGKDNNGDVFLKIAFRMGVF